MLLHGVVVCILFRAQEWIPVITRDIIRQRRQAPQPSLSDAYLSGMPSKRRKVTESFSFIFTLRIMFAYFYATMHIKTVSFCATSSCNNGH